MRIKQIVLAASLAAFAACGGDSLTLPSEGANSGSLSFNYTGAGGGAYSASGGITPAQIASNPYMKTFAIGFSDSTASTTDVAANLLKPGSTSDLVLITFAGQAPGTRNFTAVCNADTTACNSVTFVTGVVGIGGTVFTNLCTLTSGSITISDFSTTAASGSFAGSGTCLSSTGGNGGPWSVTNGSFSVPLIPGVPTTPY